MSDLCEKLIAPSKSLVHEAIEGWKADNEEYGGRYANEMEPGGRSVEQGEVGEDPSVDCAMREEYLLLSQTKRRSL